MPAQETAPPVRWTSAVQALAAAAVPVVLAVVGHFYTAGIKEREIQGRFVELALAILQTPPDTTTGNLRRWALHVVNEYSGVPLDSAVTADLQHTVTLPSAQATSTQESSTPGLAAGTPVLVHLTLAKPTRVSWARLYTPTSKMAVPRTLGPGVDSFPLPWGSTVFLTLTEVGSVDSTTYKVDCSHGCSLAP